MSHRRLGRWVPLVGASLALATAAPALAVTISGTDGQVFNSPPTFTLIGGNALADVDWMLSGPSPDFGSTPSGTNTPPLGDLDGAYTLQASQLLDPVSATRTFMLDRTAPIPPAVTSGPAAVAGPFAPFAFTWTPGDAKSVWELRSGAMLLAQGETPATQVAITPPPLPPGDLILSFSVRLVDPAGNGSGFSPPYRFIVDQTPPPAPTVVSGPRGTITGLTPAFSWQVAEGGGSFEWDVTDNLGRSVFGPAVNRAIVATSVRTPVLPLATNRLHRLTFRVRHVDAYGNWSAQSAPFPFTVSTIGGLRPIAGTTVTSLRPLLTWKRFAPGTTFYNIQIWRGRTKVLKAFPRTTSFRVPPGRLRRGVKYTWYVFAWIGAKKDYASRTPLTSWFRTPRR